MQPVDPQKRKRALPRRRGVLKLLLIPFVLMVLAVACYGGMWVLTRHGAQLAMRDQFPIPAGGQLLKSEYRSQEALIFSQWAVSSEQVVYSHPWSADTLVEWFEEQGFFTIEAEENAYYIRVNCVYTEWRGVGSCHDPAPMKPPPETWIRSLYKISYEITGPDWLPSPLPTCGRIVVYRGINSSLKIYLQTELSAENFEGTVFVVDSCSIYVE